MSGVIDKISIGIGKRTIWLILATTLISAGVSRWRNPHMRIAFLDAKLASRARNWTLTRLYTQAGAG